MPKVSRKTFLKLTAASALFAAGGLLYSRFVEPRLLRITRVALRLPRLAPEFDGYKVVQISDIHIDHWMMGDHLPRVVRLVNEQQPDLIAVTGDFVTETRGLHGFNLVTSLRDLKASDGVFAVLGNHDYHLDSDILQEVIREAGATALNNDVHVIRRRDATLYVAGIDDMQEGQPRLDILLDKMASKGAAILLAHEPDFADESAATGRFDLQLSGHSHGGQVRVPVLGPPHLPDFGKKYTRGLYRVRDMYLYTNSGIGMLPPYVRFNCRPEITVFTLAAGGR